MTLRNSSLSHGYKLYGYNSNASQSIVGCCLEIGQTIHHSEDQRNPFICFSKTQNVVFRNLLTFSVTIESLSNRHWEIRISVCKSYIERWFCPIWSASFQHGIPFATGISEKKWNLTADMVIVYKVIASVYVRYTYIECYCMNVIVLVDCIFKLLWPYLLSVCLPLFFIHLFILSSLYRYIFAFLGQTNRPADRTADAITFTIALARASHSLSYNSHSKFCKCTFKRWFYLSRFRRLTTTHYLMLNCLSVCPLCMWSFQWNAMQCVYYTQCN